MAMGGEKRKAEIIDGLAARWAPACGARPSSDSGSCGPTFATSPGRPGRARSARPLRRRPGPTSLGGTAAAGEIKLRVYNPKLEQHGWQSTHTVVEIVNDDMPFLVDSVGIEINRHGLNIHLVIHPVLAARRDEAGRLVDLGTASRSGTGRARASCCEIDRQTRPEVLTQLEADLRRVLGDVRHAVQTGRRCAPGSRPRWRRCGLERPRCRPSVGAEAEAFLAWLGAGNFTLLAAAATSSRTAPPARSCGG